MKNFGTKFLVTLLLALLLSAFCSLALAQNIENSAGYKMIPTQQWETLKQTQQSLELKLEEVKTQSVRVKKLSKELSLKLEEAEKSLAQSKQELLNSNASLEKLKFLYEEVQKLLSELTQQLNDEREKQEAIKRRMKLQQGMWLLLGVVVGKVF